MILYACKPPAARDYRDVVIEALAEGEAEAREWAVAYRWAVAAALEELHHQHVELERLCERYNKALNDARALREEIRRYTRQQVGGREAA